MSLFLYPCFCAAVFYLFIALVLAFDFRDKDLAVSSTEDKFLENKHAPTQH
jgi:hypothetical protein